MTYPVPCAPGQSGVLQAGCDTRGTGCWCKLYSHGPAAVVVHRGGMGRAIVKGQRARVVSP